MAKRGQPTKYKPEHCQAIIRFFDVEPWDTLKTKEYNADGELVNEIDTGKRQYQRMPTIEGFAKSIEVCISTVDNWTNEKHDSFQPEFLVAYNKALTYRKGWLIDVGLSGLAPANSFKFVAVNCTDMRDKNETTHGVSKELTTVLRLINGSTKGKLPQDDDRDSSGTS